MDRLIHNAHQIRLKGESLRKANNRLDLIETQLSEHGLIKPTGVSPQTTLSFGGDGSSQ